MPIQVTGPFGMISSPMHRAFHPWTTQIFTCPHLQCHLTSSATLDLSKPSVYIQSYFVLIQANFGLIQATNLVGVVRLHCTHLQCSLHFSAYTLAMQSMVSAFIQHPNKYPSRYIIVILPLIWHFNLKMSYYQEFSEHWIFQYHIPFYIQNEDIYKLERTLTLTLKEFYHHIIHYTNKNL
jgi:hypothetical protein